MIAKIVVVAGMILATALMIILIEWREYDNRKGVELGKADCIETCIRVLQTESLFPDYHRTVQKCNDVFAEVETCRLVK